MYYDELPKFSQVQLWKFGLSQKCFERIYLLPQDSSNRFHGFNEISLDPKADPNLIGTDPTLGWRVKSIKGFFKHGYLEGPNYIELQVSNTQIIIYTWTVP